MQVDTVHIKLVAGKSIRHFTGYCPGAKWTVAKARNRATATAASLFLDKLQVDMPFTVEGIRVDGGAELHRRSTLSPAEPMGSPNIFKCPERGQEIDRRSDI